MLGVQYALCASIGAVGTVTGLFLRHVAYTRHTTHGPLRDTGFIWLPDWSHHSYINMALACVSVAFLMAVAMMHKQRLIVLRRILLLWGVCQIIQVTQCVVTRLPDPRVNPPGELIEFGMHSILYTLCACFATFYSPYLVVRVAGWVVNILFMLALIATHRNYTVDVMSGVCAVLPLFLLFHWYVRNSWVIKKRYYVAWLEADVLEVYDFTHSHFNQRLGADAAYLGPGVAEQDEDHEPPDRIMEHFEAQMTFAGTEQRDTVVEELKMIASEVSPMDQIKHSLTVLGVVAFFALCMLVSSIAMLNFVNKERPINRHKLPDTGHEVLPSIYDHTPDYMLWAMLGVTFLYILCLPQRFMLLRQTGALYTILMWMRCLTVPATFLPDPSPICSQREHAPGTTCGDLIYSGHTIAFMLGGAIFHRMAHRYVSIGVWIYVFFSLLAIIASDLHYSRDVVTALLVMSTFYAMYWSMIVYRPDRILRYPVLRWFEMDHYYYLMRTDPTYSSSVGHGAGPVPIGHGSNTHDSNNSSNASSSDGLFHPPKVNDPGTLSPRQPAAAPPPLTPPVTGVNSPANISMDTTGGSSPLQDNGNADATSPKRKSE